MIYDWLISVPKVDDPAYDPETRPTNWIRLGEYGDNWVYMDHTDMDPLERPELSTSKLLGQWDFDGMLYGTLDPDYDLIRPLGNQTITTYDEQGNPINTEEGVATKELRYSHGLGWRQRNRQETSAPDTLAEYPATEQPIVLTMARRFDDTPGFEGQGWVATIEFSDPNRDAGVRAIGIYDDNWNYLYTTGAFVWTEVEPGPIDPETGEPLPGLYKWQTQNPAGRVTPTPEPVYYALLYASLQEGRMELTAQQDERVDHFWEFNQDNTQNTSGVDLLYYEGALLEYQQEGMTYG